MRRACRAGLGAASRTGFKDARERVTATGVGGLVAGTDGAAGDKIFAMRYDGMH